MLSFLRISNLAILDDVALEPGPGLNVLTGETGAGKSIIVDAIGLLLGSRGSVDLIRTGCDRLVVEAQYELSPGTVQASLPRPGTDSPVDDDVAEWPGDGELIIRRELLATGRGRATLNGRMIALSSLRLIGERLADLHGQHEQQSLLQASGQRDALDQYAGHMDLRQEVGEAHAALRALEREQDALAGRERDRSLHEEILTRQIAEIEKVSPLETEEIDLKREESLLRNAAEVARLSSATFTLLSDDDDSVVARLGMAEERLGRLAAIDRRAEGILDLLRESRVAAAEAARSVSSYTQLEEFDPARLEHVASRLSDLEGLKRKYGGSMAAVLARLKDARSGLEALSGAGARLSEISARLAEARERYLSLARRLSAGRGRAAVQMEKAVHRELKPLAMEDARVSIRVSLARGIGSGSPDPCEVREGAVGAAAPHGIDLVEFLIAANKGEEPRPLARVASGGELSRLMLAVRHAIGSAGDHRTLIFDEVDSGIGGVVAEAVGLRLSALSRRQQVFCVTHLPQIASLADRHFRVSKQTTAGRTCAIVELLDSRGRVEEVARMLGGKPPETARRHAEALMERKGRD